MNKPIISYVIPCYNCEGTIVDTVLSIKDTHEFVMEKKGLPSKWDQMEVILVNDGSTDSTHDIIDSLASKFGNVVVLDNEENKGRGYSRNRGNKHACADIIAVLDSDDLNIGDRTGTTLKAFEQNPETDLFYGSFLSSHSYMDHLELKEASPVNSSWLQKTGQFRIGHSTVAYKRSTILKYPYSEDKNKDDWDMLWRLYTNHAKFNHTKKVLSAYIIEKSDIVKNLAPNKQSNILKKKKKIMDQFFNRSSE